MNILQHLSPGNGAPCLVMPGRVLSYADMKARADGMALRMGGTCSGEHGVGLGKMKYLQAEHGDALDVMRTIKQALDPDDLMNPGKMLPDPSAH